MSKKMIFVIAISLVVAGVSMVFSACGPHRNTVDFVVNGSGG